jgi:1,4-dihydroxy-2-naphthoate octaprenyltransferase
LDGVKRIFVYNFGVRPIEDFPVGLVIVLKLFGFVTVLAGAEINGFAAVFRL